MHNSLTIANRFLALAEDGGDTLTPMQVLKLVYIAHGWMYGLYGRPLIRDEIQAWQYGPVIPRLYDAVRGFKDQPVRGPLKCSDMERLSAAEESIIRQVYENYGKMSGPALSRLTHKAGTPWDITYRPGSFGLVISSDLIESHYRNLAASQS